MLESQRTSLRRALFRARLMACRLVIAPSGRLRFAEPSGLPPAEPSSRPRRATKRKADGGRPTPLAGTRGGPLLSHVLRPGVRCGQPHGVLGQRRIAAPNVPLSAGQPPGTSRLPPTLLTGRFGSFYFFSFSTVEPLTTLGSSCTARYSRGSCRKPPPHSRLRGPPLQVSTLWFPRWRETRCRPKPRI